MNELRNGLNNQLTEKQNDRLNTRRMNSYYAKMLQERDNKDIEREKKEKERIKNLQREYHQKLSEQVKDHSNRLRFQDMMSDQERRMHEKDIQAYQAMDPFRNAIQNKPNPIIKGK